MKVALFTNSYLPYLSGITLSVSMLAWELRNLDHEVIVAAPAYPGYRETDPGIIRLPSLPAGYPGYRFVLPFSPRLSTIKPDLIHVHQPFGVGLAALFLARKLKVPLVYTFHTLFPRYVHHAPFVPTRLAKWAVASYLSFFCGRVDAVIVPSQMVRRYLISALKIKRRIEVIPTGVNLDNLSERKQMTDHRYAVRKKYDLPNDAKILLYVGRLSREKNVSFLLEALAKILQTEKKVYLLLIGGGPDEREYKNLARKLGIAGQTIFAGSVRHPQIYNYYFASDLFVYASRSETQGLVLVEAKAAGLPVVAVSGGGISDVLEDGLDSYVLPEDRGLFAEHALRLLREEGLHREMSHKAREDAHDRFSSRVIAKKTEAVYQSLLS